jgi:hypothetical protein
MQQAEYGRYEGESQYSEFADILVRKIKSELGQEKDALVRSRLVLAVTSVCAVVILFWLLVLALMMGVVDKNVNASYALGWGFVSVCGVIIMVNAYFNFAGSKMHKNERAKEEAKSCESKAG